MQITETQTNHKAIVITGGPGMGKTSIINCLLSLGYTTVTESGREIILNEVKQGGSKLPWMDRSAFAEEMFDWAIKDYEKFLNVDSPVFFDRGIPDVIGYMKLCGLAVPNRMLQAASAYKYNSKIYIAPPWEEIYTNDEERKQSFSETIDTYQVMEMVYSDLGYEVIEIPKTSIAERTNFVILDLDL